MSTTTSAATPSLKLVSLEQIQAHPRGERHHDDPDQHGDDVERRLTKS
jgi:hypothetical protein